MKDLIYAKSIQNKDKRDNETFVYRHLDMVGKEFTVYKGKTMHEIYKNRQRKPYNRYLGNRKKIDGKLSNKISWLTNLEVLELAEKLGSGLINLQLVERINEWNNYNLQFLGVYSKNSLNYLIQDIACCLYDITTIPIYDTLGEKATQFAFEQTKMKTCLISASHLENIVKAKKQGEFQYLKNLIILDSENLKNLNQDVLKVLTFEQVLKAGENRKPWAQVSPSSIYAFSYTSGTTGTPKGAMISHQNMMSVILACNSKIQVNEQDSYLSYLPMAHSLERNMFNTLSYYGCQIAVYGGDIKKIKEDLAILKPTIFVTVPRLFNKMHDAIQKKFKQASCMLQPLISKGIKSKLNNLHKKGETKHWLYDALIFNKVKKVLGGRVKKMATGSAPIDPSVLDFLKIAFCAPILEGYGQTEGCSYEFSTDVRDGISGHVGGPFIENEFKLVDVPEMNYLSTDRDENGNSSPRGEIWVRGPNIIPGYYKLDQKNKETITQDGWLQSGDIGQLLYPNNALKIIDRKKNIFKLAQGEYIAPEKLENAYANTTPLINDVFVYGDSLKSSLVAVVNFEKDSLTKYCQYNNLQQDTESKELKDHILNSFLQTNKEQKFNSLEKIRAIFIDTIDWQEQDLITTSFKKKRFQLKKYYQKQIDQMYSDLQ